MVRTVRGHAMVDGLITIRRATIRDLSTLVYHWHYVWADQGYLNRRRLEKSDSVFRQWAREQIREGGLLVWLAEVNGVAVASESLWLKPITPLPHRDGLVQPYLCSLYTEPKWRHRGIATRLVRAAAKWSRRHKYQVVMLYSSKPARKMYTKMGFKRTWDMELVISPGQKSDWKPGSR